jgi:predicted ATPase
MTDGNVEDSLVGRAEEIALIQVALDEALAGSSKSLVIAGEPGIGKSALIASAHAMAGKMGFVSTRKVSSSVPEAPPLWLWRDALSDLNDSDQTKELFTGAASSASNEPGLEQRFQLFDAIRRFLAESSNSSPIVISIDDMQWADEATNELFIFLSRHLTDSRVLLVAGVRVADHSEPSLGSKALDSLRAASSSEVITPRRLRQEELVDLAIQVNAPKPSPHVAELLHQRSEGVPFFAIELCKQISTDGQSVRGELPLGIRSALDSVLGALQPDQIALLQAAVTLGARFTSRQLTQLLEKPQAAIINIVAGCEAAGVIRVSADAPGSFDFTHPLLAEQVRAATPVNSSARLHLRAADQIEGRSKSSSRVDVATLAWHYSEAAPIAGTEKLIHYSLLAGEEALQSSSRSDAYRHYDLVRRALGDDDVSLELAHAWLWLASALYTLESSWGSELTPEQILEGLIRAFEIFLSNGEIELAVAAASQGIISLTSRLGPGARELVERGMEIIEETSPQMSRLLTQYGDVIAINEPESQRSIDLLEQAFDLAESRGDTAQQLKARRIQCQTLRDVGEFA